MSADGGSQTSGQAEGGTTTGSTVRSSTQFHLGCTYRPAVAATAWRRRSWRDMRERQTDGLRRASRLLGNLYLHPTDRAAAAQVSELPGCGLANSTAGGLLPPGYPRHD
jgi:hypothetical protein